MPVRLPAGAVARTVKLDVFEGWRVGSCPLFWPDIERDLSKLKVSDSAEEIKQKNLLRAAYFQRCDNRPGRSLSGTERTSLIRLLKKKSLPIHEIGKAVKTARIVDGVIMVTVGDGYQPVEMLL